MDRSLLGTSAVEADMRGMTGVPSITDVRSQRLVWTGHVARRDDQSNLKRMLRGIPYG